MDALMQMCCICIILLAFSLAAVVFILFDIYRIFKANGWRWRHNTELCIFGITNQISILRDEISKFRDDYMRSNGYIFGEKDDKK